MFKEYFKRRKIKAAALKLIKDDLALGENQTCEAKCDLSGGGCCYPLTLGYINFYHNGYQYHINRYWLVISEYWETHNGYKATKFVCKFKISVGLSNSLWEQTNTYKKNVAKDAQEQKHEAEQRKKIQEDFEKSLEID